MQPVPLSDFDRYLVSEDGRIWSTTMGGRHSLQRITPLPLAAWVDEDGYGHVNLMGKSGQRKRFAVHVLVLMTYVGPRPYGCEEARHLDGNSLNNGVSNLSWGTRAENGADKVRHGRSTFGVRNAKAKLSDVDVRAIRAAPHTRGSGVALAVRYGVHYNTISRIRRGIYWRNVDCR